jgi:hypothetical protein
MGLTVLPPVRPAVPVHASRNAARFASGQIEAAIATGWSKKKRAILFDDILAHLFAATDDDGRICIIMRGEGLPREGKG